jgi:hypothetical protein
MTNTNTLRPVTSLYDLRTRAKVDPRYLQLAINAAQNLGGTPRDLDGAIRWFNLNMMETGEDEQSIVNEINFCI